MGAPMVKTSGHDAVLEFLNTVLAESKPYGDLLQSDDDVVLWLKKSGFLSDCLSPRFEPGELVAGARSLRELLRELIAQRKAGEKVEFARLNTRLAHGNYTMELVEVEQGRLQAIRRFSQDTVEQVLAPVALVGADLLAQADFKLVRKCEGDECPRWFYDRTKAHRRRWCNMAVCGNRQKAARFRTRMKAD
ncbi:Conserved protein containing a Zn-ribbon-like motif [Paraburkholderia caribensis MBA4]|uniref:Conserved protein containing a Zn-ribbon-like motif n=2 Tax=Paraburkholderia caribensis TaxID=75105 RepID=A0A0N7JV63_9BURK|nr:Conserved protein containing a Zn-ribbon-like motif [Paraburkholderia caribensis MBA4]